MRDVRHTEGFGTRNETRRLQAAIRWNLTRGKTEWLFQHTEVSDLKKVTVTSKLYIKLQPKVKRRESTTHCWWYPSYAQWARLYLVHIYFEAMISACLTSKFYCYCYCVQRAVNVKESLLRLQKRNIEIHVYRLSTTCLHLNPSKISFCSLDLQDPL